MMGLLLWNTNEGEKRPKAVTISERMVLRTRFLQAEIRRGEKAPEAILRRRVTAAARRLRRAGVTEAVLPEDFPWRALLEKQGVRPVSDLGLRRALATALVRRQVERAGASPAGARVAVAGESLTGELVRTVRELALLYRYVLVDVPGGEELCRQLRREYGVSLLLSPSREQLEEAEALVLFSPRGETRGRGVLPLYEGGGMVLPPLTLPRALEDQLPRGADRPMLLAALHRAGAIRTEQVQLGT